MDVQREEMVVEGRAMSKGKLEQGWVATEGAGAWLRCRSSLLDGDEMDGEAGRAAVAVGSGRRKGTTTHCPDLRLR